MFGPMLFWMQAQICIENGGIVTQVCAFIHPGRVETEFLGETNKTSFEFLLSGKVPVCPSAATAFKRW